MIKGTILRDAIISGSNNIANQIQAVDELNVFPVPDGDTGTNMSMTISAAAKELVLLSNCTVSQVSATAASALLRGARGNSGVILSLLFRGFAKSLTGKDTANGGDLAAALSLGVEFAYKAVMTPTEGTILTVARVAAEKAIEFSRENEDEVAVWDKICEVAAETLEQTPELLPVLKKAGVVDAGGKGFLVIIEGMRSVIRDGKIIETVKAEPVKKVSEVSKNAAGKIEVDINFPYCTEFLVKKSESSGKDPLALRAYLESIGDSAVVVDDDAIIKVHVHSACPGKVLQAALDYGSLINIKIDNMLEQHLAQAKKVEDAKKEEADAAYAPVDPDTPYGFVAVCAGDGLSQLFADLGVNQVVSGGQTMNPSTDDILRAIHATPAQTVFVLPNNKNIIMAAEQTVNLADRKVFVLPTRTIPQGLSAMLAFDPESGISDNQLSMTKAADSVETGLITFAARESDFDGHKIHKDEILALHGSKLLFTEKDMSKAATKLARSLVSKSSSFVTVIYGEDVAEDEAAAVVETLKSKLGDSIEVALINGGQPVYYYIISVE